MDSEIAYKRSKAITRYTFGTSYRNSWRKFVSSINQNTSLHTAWKRVQKIEGNFSPSPSPVLVNHNNDLISEPGEVAEMLSSHFSQVSGEQNYSQTFRRSKAQKESRPINFNTGGDQPYNDQISELELRTALSKTTETSPGEDQITYLMIKRAHHTLLPAILVLFNMIFSEQTLPSGWTSAIIIAIPKPGKDHKIGNNYRPISLTSCLCKLLEKIINWRLMWYLEVNGLIGIQQSGFRSNRSTTDHLAQLENDLREALNERQHTLAVFFDIQKAYDTAWRFGVLSYMSLECGAAFRYSYPTS
jgi:potassium voltage-gated channel Eag-related subfamily H protein 8